MAQSQRRQRQFFDRIDLCIWSVTLTGMPPVEWLLLGCMLVVLYLFLLGSASSLAVWWQRLSAVLALLIPLIGLLGWAFASWRRQILSGGENARLIVRLLRERDQQADRLAQMRGQLVALHDVSEKSLKLLSSARDEALAVASSQMGFIDELMRFLDETEFTMRQNRLRVQRAEAELDWERRLGGKRSDAAQHYSCIIKYLEENPGATASEAARHCGVKPRTARRALEFRWPEDHE